MEEYIEGGARFNFLAEGSHDQYLNLMMDWLFSITVSKLDNINRDPEFIT